MRVRSLLGLTVAVMFSVATLGAAGAGVNTEAPAPATLADAVQHRDKQAVAALLKKHADVNAPQGDGTTALHWAAYLEDADTTALLIRAGAKVNAPNSYGITPLVARRRKRQRRTSSSSC